LNSSEDQASQDGKVIQVAVVVAHPDDEILWAGGLLLKHPEWSTVIITLCRSSDRDRAPRFRRVLRLLGASGAMGDLDDAPEQIPLQMLTVQETILSLLPERQYDILLTHAPEGEYTWHQRHGEAAYAVRTLWQANRLHSKSLWQFAYEDGGGAYFPRPQKDADVHLALPDALWTRKRNLITQIYGFDPTSWEAQTTPHTEAFRCFSHSGEGQPHLSTAFPRSSE